MFPRDESRTSLAIRQAALVDALISGRAAPPGFDSQRVLAAAESLARKRARSVLRAWPRLAYAMGPEFGLRFAEYAAASSIPEKGGPLADGHAFARWLRAHDRLPDAGCLELMAVALRYRRVPAGLVRRRGPVLRMAWFHASRRIILAVRLPSLGERWLHLHLS